MQLRDGTPREVGMLTERVARARDVCATWVKEGHTPAISVCVARRGVVVLHEAFGVLGPEADAPTIDVRTLYPLSSSTKPVTATLVMQLVEDGLIGLNRPVRDYIPEIPAGDTDEILVHHLLTHTSGWANWDEEPLVSHGAKKEEGFQIPEIDASQHLLQTATLQVFLDAPLSHKPGELMHYSTHNYELLVEIARRATGRSHWELAQERIFDPLGMEDTFWIVPELESGRVVQRPESAVGGAVAHPILFQEIGSRQMQETPYGGGGLFSTPRDMTVFGQVFLQDGLYAGERILSPASVRAMTRDQIPGLKAQLGPIQKDIAGWGYGFGLETTAKWVRYRGSLRSLGSFDHGGMGGAYFWIDPAQDLVAAYFGVTLEMDEESRELWNADLFQNVVASAIDD